jgi:prepilin-type N-terminal cleavage/methylation domain-containing protein
MKGFTLIEVLVTTVILSIILGALFMVLSMGQRSWFTGDVAVELRDQTIRALMTMDKELSATHTTRVTDGSGNPLVEGTAVNSIEFDMPTSMIDSSWSAIDADGDMQWTGPITYSRVGTQVIRNFRGTNWTIANNITNLQFTWTLTNMMQIDITARKKSNMGWTIPDIEQALIEMRN